jgi:hypothetical protein
VIGEWRSIPLRELPGDDLDRPFWRLIPKPFVSQISERLDVKDRTHDRVVENRLVV